MTRYLLKRILYILPVMLVVSIIVFSTIHLVPGDVVDAMVGTRSDEETREAMRRELGLDKSIVEQYFMWLSRVLRGDFGRSIFTNQPVAKLIREKLPATLLLSLSTLLLTVTIAIPLGTLAASRQNTPWDVGALGTALFATSLPSFWLGIMLVLFFGVYLGWLPTLGYVPFFSNPLRCIHHLLLPSLTLSAAMIGAVTRMARSQVLEELQQDYVRTARAKGLSQSAVTYRHALRNAMLPVLTVLGLQFGWMLGSAIVVEELFAWPGVGRLVIEAIYGRDYPVLQGTVLVIACLFIFVNLLVDVVYSFLDPRIRYD